MSNELKLIQAKLDEQTIKEIEELLQTAGLNQKEKLHYIKLVAFYVILTSCENGEGTENMRSEYRDSSLLKIHQHLICLFDKHTDAIEKTKSNFNRPLLRRNKNGTQELSGTYGDVKSARLWRMEESGVKDPSSGNNFTAVEVPEEYKIGSRSALFFIIMNDIIDSFLSSQFKAVEIPCFVKMFRASSANNRNNFLALIGEYVALVNLCLYEGFIGPASSFRCYTKRYDFAIETGNRVRKISVKSVCFTESRLFAMGQGSAIGLWQEEVTKEITFVTGPQDVNILLHDCDCDHCAQNQVWKTCVQNGCIDCSNTGTTGSKSNKDAAGSEICLRINNFKQIVKHIIKGTVYFIRVDMVFELRYAFNIFDIIKFRCQPAAVPHGAPTGSRNRGMFNLKDFLVWSLDPGRECGNEISDQLQALIDRLD